MAYLAAVLKVGGSLSRDPALPELCTEIAALASQHPLLVLPGGGEFADLVRDFDAFYGLSDLAAHRMAISAMDQYGCLLGDLLPDSVLVADLLTARQQAARGRTPILLPSNLLLQLDPLPHSWQVTSDSIAAWLAGTLGAPLLVLLKDVDGLCAVAPGTGAGEQLIPRMDIEQLASHQGGVDEHLALVLGEFEIETWVINGKFPHRLRELLTVGQTLGSCIVRG